MEATLKIEETFTRVRKLSFEEKKHGVFDEAKINSLLDTILDFKKSLADKTEKIEDLVERMEKLTWYNDSDISGESLMKINDLISSARDLYNTLLRQCIGINNLRDKGIATTEIKAYKSAMENLRDVADDLDSRFFFLPKLTDFIETTKVLSSL